MVRDGWVSYIYLNMLLEEGVVVSLIVVIC